VEWWQGSTFYEIFPASFQDSRKGSDGIGDLRGITMRLDYLKGIGVRAIRLNSIFPALHYPEYYSNINNMTDVNRELGTLEDFSVLVREIHRRNISLILDLPLYPFMKNNQKAEFIASVKKINETEQTFRDKRDTINDVINRQVLPSPPAQFDTLRDVSSSVPHSSDHSNRQLEHPISKAINIWQQRGVDGFYLKGLEHYVNENTFVTDLRYWKFLLHPNNILMCHINALNAAISVAAKNSILSRIDLIDVTLYLTNGTKNIKAQIENITKGVFFEKAAYPWIHWSIGGVDISRVASILGVRNASVAASLLNMMLPGSSSIFYGDEVYIIAQ